MKRLLSTTSFFICLFLTFILIAFNACQNDDCPEQTPCDDDDMNVDDDDDDDTADDDDDNDTIDDDDDPEDNATGGVWIDPDTGLMWQKEIPDFIVDWFDADMYCRNLVLEGRADWRLPTISELRTLIRGCPNTEADGPCGVTDDCCDFLCRDNESFCDGCAENEGPTSGCYMTSELNDRCRPLWTSIWESNCDDKKEASESIWVVDYKDGALKLYDMVDDRSNYRCVRDEQSKQGTTL